MRRAWVCLLIGCTASPASKTEPPTTDSATQPTGSTDPCDAPHGVHGTGSAPGHIHNVVFWGCTHEVVLGTHEGTWRTEAGAHELVGLAAYGDFMGLTQSPFDDQVYWASGHFHDVAVGNSGFLESTDGGLTWTPVSLSGEADLHQIVPSLEQEGLVVGSYDRKFYVSEDTGRTWEAHFGAPWWTTGLAIVDVVGPVLLVSSPAGIDRVALPDGEPERLFDGDIQALTARGAGIAYSTAASELVFCDDRELTDCTVYPGPSPTEPVVAFLFGADVAEVYVVTAGSEVWHTHDVGAGTWELVASDAPLDTGAPHTH